jgi:diaminopimelate decarboxylase
MGIIYRRALESGSGTWWHEHDGEPSAFSVRDYANTIVPPLRELGIRILVEPGRFLVGNAGVLLTRVLYIKETEQKKFAIIDAGMNDLIRPALYESYHQIVPVVQPSMSRNKTEKMDIVGPVCESGDFLPRIREMPELRPGDLLAVMSAAPMDLSWRPITIRAHCRLRHWCAETKSRSFANVRRSKIWSATRSML